MARPDKLSDEIKVTKLDAARRQLQTALELWFSDKDPVSIHTLAFAAHEIIHRLYRRKGFSDLLFDSSIIKEEHRAEYVKMLKRDANFIKHAERDAEADQARDFNPTVNELYLVMTVVGLDAIGESKSLGDVGSAFRFWLRVHRSHWYRPEERIENSVPVDLLERIRAIKKPDFFQAFLDLRRDGVIHPH